MRLLAIPVLLLSLLTTACQTSMLKQFDQIKPGMEKDDVLSLMGSPNRTQRFHGKDRWTYVFYDDRIRFEREVQFFEGNAIYVGEIWQPEPERTAVAMDMANDKKNRAIDEESAREVEIHRQAYEKFESQSKGTDRVRYVPKFEPIR